jgi:hypothetical protein
VLVLAAADFCVDVWAVSDDPAGVAFRLSPIRVALWDKYGGSSSSGWTRWMLEQYEFPHEVVYPQALDEGNLAARYDVIILTDEALQQGTDIGIPAELVPPQYRKMLGTITMDRTVPRLKQFVDAGGTLLLIGDATGIAERLGVPVTNALMAAGPGTARPLPQSEFYIPGSLLRVRVDNASPIAYGLDREADVFFDVSPVFRLQPGAAARGVRRVAWYDSPAPLRSGWAWGQRYLEDGAAVIDAPVGKGRVVLCGPEINYRAQPHGTFKFLFNAIQYARAVPARPGGRASAP